MQEENQDALRKQPCKSHAKHANKFGYKAKRKTMCHQQRQKKTYKPFFLGDNEMLTSAAEPMQNVHATHCLAPKRIDKEIGL